MAYTEKYCVARRWKLLRKDRSPEATAFPNACRSTDGNTARYKEVIIEEDGVCFACGKRDYVKSTNCNLTGTSAAGGAIAWNLDDSRSGLERRS